ncbi:hypothetical protein AKJ49_02145 [candidate division MSBL1 archaeon SCGC-AAA382A03]|uniref:Damage-control phosphatase ARMT1-like metal-binding domain-containing protein n=1 Tax=candidate division MSBL1 archaeon SCGC-AAA382A03 TaxID=1698278 RepID=A0A133VD68_9EURY|nr:hypothetical protein AKJ49_02145 [candidate division MSBL1 archaeon SCGC-AAA382A03]
MKIKPKCISCEIKGAFEQIKLSTEKEDVTFKALRAILNYLHTASFQNITPAEVGAERNRIIKEITSCFDPYLEIKNKMNDTARKLKPLAKDYISKGENEKDKFKRAIKTAVLGNYFDFSVSEHEIGFSTLKEKFRSALDMDINHDESETVTCQIFSSDKILYLLDNPGEAILDQLLLKEILKNGCRISIAARSGPVQDDVTLEMAEELNLSKFGNLIPAGQSPGVNPKKAPKELKRELDSADVIISKGQGNYEILSEFESSYKGRLAYLLMSKCEPVSASLGVPKGSMVVSFVAGVD